MSDLAPVACPDCGHAMILIYDNGHAYRWCPVCGHKEMVY